MEYGLDKFKLIKKNITKRNYYKYNGVRKTFKRNFTKGDRGFIDKNLLSTYISYPMHK